MKKARSKTNPGVVEFVDKASACCRHITGIAQLMRACGHADMLTPQSIVQIGEMIADEAETLHGLVVKFPQRIKTSTRV
jgi:hypothetical protein